MTRKPLSKAEREQLEQLTALSDDAIDTTDIPELSEESWPFARRGKYYRPRKQPVTIRLDADVLAWFKENASESGRGYQTEINRVLRRHVATTEKNGT